MFKIFLTTFFGVVSALAAPDTKSNALSRKELKSYMENLGDDFVLEKIDTENRGTADMFMVFKSKSGQGKALVYQLFDFNKDGKVDLVNHFQKEKKIKSEYDLDFDGKADTMSDFNEAGNLEKKTLFEDKNLVSLYWHNGDLRRKEVDRNGDGSPDMWVHYRNGRVVKTEIDVNFDGKNIRLEGDLNKKSN